MLKQQHWCFLHLFLDDSGITFSSGDVWFQHRNDNANGTGDTTRLVGNLFGWPSHVPAGWLKAPACSRSNRLHPTANKQKLT
jgi:hypothetical protein